jgi:hypothetical protein
VTLRVVEQILAQNDGTSDHPEHVEADAVARNREALDRAGVGLQQLLGVRFHGSGLRVNVGFHGGVRGGASTPTQLALD